MSDIPKELYDMVCKPLIICGLHIQVHNSRLSSWRKHPPTWRAVTLCHFDNSGGDFLWDFLWDKNMVISYNDDGCYMVDDG